MKKGVLIGIISICMIFVLIGCGANDSKKTTSKGTNNTSYTALLYATDIFTDRDLNQDLDTSDATKYTLSSNEDITITEEGIYLISGKASNSSIIVDTDDNSKVQIVLSNVTINNSSKPCIYVKNADKVFVTSEGTNSLTVSSTFTSDGNTNTDAVIFSKDDLVLNGTGTITISSSDNGITSKDDLKITGGTINITCSSDALEANNSIAIANGNITINSKKDGLHAEYSDDDSVGYVYISGGTINITASDDAIHATTIVEIDNGNITTNSHEGIEATYIQINDGTLNLQATDDGMNAGNKSSKYETTIEINGGSITIDMGTGDTDAIDSNGNIYIAGGTINITARSPFDYDGESKYTGGTIIVNGTETNQITNQQMGGPQGGGRR